MVLVIYFTRFKEWITCLILFKKFSDVLLAFTCTSAFGNRWRIFLGVNITISFPLVDFNGNSVKN